MSIDALMASALPPLAVDVELELCRAWRERQDRRARDMLVRAHLRLVYSVARRFVRPALPLEEALAIGLLATLRALETHDPDRGRLATYVAWYVAKACSRAAAHSSTVVAGGWSGTRRARCVLENLDLSVGRDGPLAKARERRRVARAQRTVARFGGGDVSIDGIEGGSARLEQLASDLPGPDELAEAASERARVRAVVAGLPVTFQRALERRMDHYAAEAERTDDDPPVPPLACSSTERRALGALAAVIGTEAE